MDNENSTKTCSNCKYFKRYFIVSPAITFMPLNKGHCGRPYLNRKISDERVASNAGCDLWQPRELEKLRQQYCIELALQDVNKILSDILAVLRDVE